MDPEEAQLRDQVQQAEWWLDALTTMGLKHYARWRAKQQLSSARALLRIYLAKE